MCEINEMPERVVNFLDYLEENEGRSEGTIDGYKIDLSLFFKWIKRKKLKLSGDLEETNISDINDDFIKNIVTDDLDQFISYVGKYRKNGKNAKARKIATLKKFFWYMYKKAKVMHENIGEDVCKIKPAERNPKYLSVDESKMLIDTVKNDTDNKFIERDICIVTWFLHLGLRVSELCGVRLSKINGDTLTVIGKGDKEREMTLNKKCLEALEVYLNKRKEIEPKIIDKDFLFISKNYNAINKRSVENIIKKYIMKATNKDMNCHALRHSCFSMLHGAGVDIRTIQQLAGHSSIQTSTIYIHLNNQQVKEAVASNPLND